MNSKGEPKKLIAVLFAFSLVVRLLVLAIFPAPALDDSARIYLAAAHLLMDGKGFGDPSFPFYNPPLYSVFIAMCLSMFGDDQVSVKIVQTFADSLTIVLVYFIMREIFDIETGLLSAGILCLYPYSIYLTTSIASEPLFTLFLSGFVLSTLYSVRSDQVWYYCASGVLVGLATLIRATTQFVPLLFLVMLLLVRERGRELLFCYTAFFLSFALVVLPWTIRNYVVLDDFIPVGTSGGVVMLQGSSEKFLTIDGKPDMLRAYSPLEGNKPSQNDRFFMRAALERNKIHLQTDPIGFVAFMARKFFRLWYATESGSNHNIILFSQIPVYIFALAGLVLAWMKNKSLAWIPLCAIVYFAVLHWLSLPLFRYMMPIMPYVIGFGAFAIATLRNEWIIGKKIIRVVNE